MPLFRVERRAGLEWQLLHGRVDARTEQEAVAYIKAVLPHRCNGARLRARSVEAQVTTVSRDTRQAMKAGGV